LTVLARKRLENYVPTARESAEREDIQRQSYVQRKSPIHYEHKDRWIERIKKQIDE